MNDPNECPCTTGHNSFDGLTLAELGAQMQEYEDRLNQHADRWRPHPEIYRLQRSDEDGHLENDDYRRRHPAS